MLKNLLPNEVKVNITIDDVRLRSNLTTNKTIKFTKKSFFYTILGFIESHSAPLSDIKGFVQLIPGIYKSEKPIDITGIDKVHLKYDCVDGSVVNGVRQADSYSFALSSHPVRKKYKELMVKLFENIIKSVSYHKTFYLEDDDHKPVDFIGERISFTCQLNRVL